MKIAVLGAGVVGVTSAFYLAKSGHEVVLIDSEDEAATLTSFANGGQLSYSYTDPLATPAIWYDLPKLLLGLDPSFKISCHNNWRLLIPWAIKFLACCNNKSQRNTIKTLLEITNSSMQEFNHLNDEYQLNFCYQHGGKLHIYSNLKEFAIASKNAKYKQSLGVQQVFLNPAECVGKMPDLKDYQQKIVGGIFSPSDEMCDVNKFSQQLLNCGIQQFKLTTSLGTKINSIYFINKKITQINTNNGVITADKYVVAMGAYSTKLLQPLGINLPIYPLKGYSLTLQATDKAQDISITDAHNKIVITKLDDRLRVAGIAHFDGFNNHTTPKYIDRLISTARILLPNSADYSKVLHTWSGLRPMTPSNRPIIGTTKFDNLLLNTGHGMLGLTLSTGSAAKLCEYI